MKARLPRSSESGIALITTLLVLMLTSALMVGFFGAITADQKSSGIDRDQTQAYAAAHAGLEKLTTDLALLFEDDFSPSTDQIDELLGVLKIPDIPGFEYEAAGGASGYLIESRAVDKNGEPAPLDIINGTPISSGPYQGLRGIVTRYDLTATAKSPGAETRLRRSLQTVSIPVFQFGVFSETDLSFFAGPDFNFGGRVHTNGNLYLAEGNNKELILADRVTAAGEIVRARLSNGHDTTGATYGGRVRVAKAPGSYVDLLEDEGSVVDALVGPPPAAYDDNEPKWTDLSMGTYNGYIRNGKTGAKQLDLPLVAEGVDGVPIDLIRRPVVNEDVDRPVLYSQRYYSEASLRILLSDTRADIEALPGMTADQAVTLDGGDWNAGAPNPNGTAYGPVDLTHPPIALSGGIVQTTTSGTTSTATTFRVAAIPAFYQMPLVAGVHLTITGPLTTSGTVTIRTVVCTGRDADEFTGCRANNTTATTFASGAVISATVGGQNITTVTSGTWNPTTAAAGNAIDTGTDAQNRTNAFAPTMLFIDGRIATCLGYNTVPNPDEFLVCSGVTTAQVNLNNLPVSNGALTPALTGTIGGFIKIEKQAAPVPPAVDGVWTDVTMEILNLGIGATNQIGGSCGTDAALFPNAVLRMQRLRDNGGTCNYNTLAAAPAGSMWQRMTEPTNWWPNVLYDPREGNTRDNFALTAPLELGGVIHYIALDVNNLRLWFAGTIGATGDEAWNNNGYIVYFSDRRNNRNAASLETGEYGWEDIVNPTTLAGTGAAAGTLETGEDFNDDGVLDVYGSFPNFGGVYNTVAPGSIAPLDATARPNTNTTAGNARVNRAVLFRRALKVVNGGIDGLGNNSLPVSGLTIVAENPVYVMGNYNATAASVTGNNSRPAAIIADAVTLLSNDWTDSESFLAPHNPAGRDAASTGYRMAIVAGKGLSFAKPTYAPTPVDDFGTDGGVHNFLRYVEAWGGFDLRYRGSIVSLYTSRQGTGTYKCCTNVYGPPNRIYSFDTNFLSPALLPPGTPMFRDVNTLTFRQLLRPTE